MAMLNLDESTHTYTLGDRKLISVTQCLSILDNRWKVDPWYLERGRLIHLATEYLDHDELDWSTVDERIRPYLDAYVKFRKDTGSVAHPGYIEHKLYHPIYFYAGRIDRIGYLNGCLVLIDLKTGASAKIDELQDAAYWELCRVNNIPIKKVFDLYLHDDGTYKLEPIERPKLLLPVFLAALTVARWRENA
jgi:gamma-glutamylcyclotransferase (GGCT)/AIG2-like uncharacterized protein YtfP